MVLSKNKCLARSLLLIAGISALCDRVTTFGILGNGVHLIQFTKELRAYILAHREDMEPLRVLYSRRSPDSAATWYPALFTPETIKISEDAIKQRIKKIENQKKQAYIRTSMKRFASF